jgi:hypothetical protein
MCLADRSDIAHDVLSYMLAHKRAHDTLEGIVEWWLLEKKIERNTAEVKSVLDELSTKKLIVESRAADNRIRYRVNRRKQTEIVALLNEIAADKGLKQIPKT